MSEFERDKEMLHRSLLRTEAEKDRIRDQILKFKKAEDIRNGHRALVQSKFFHQNLKLLSAREEKV
jgi:hypothetical protein